MADDLAHSSAYPVDAAIPEADELAAASQASTLHTQRQRIDRRLGRIVGQFQARDAPLAQPQGVWTIPATQGWFALSALTTAIIVIALRLVYLDTLQNEIYNDIAIIFRYINRIQAGEWPLTFVLSAGPLYHYTIMPVIAVTGLNYFGLKLASVVVSLGVLLATYALSQRLVDRSFALLATLIAGVSSWLLIFSRLGNSQIMVPLLAITALWLVVRVVQTGQRRDMVACATVAALGLYTYPQSFVLPGVIFATLVVLRWCKHPIRWQHLLLFVGVTVLCALPFIWILFQDVENFTSGYVGNKIQSETNPVAVLAGNVVRAMLAFHVHGDVVFRSNPVNVPHLDWISGVLFLVGVLFWLQPQRWRWSPVLLVPFVLLQVPSMLVLSKPVEVPSASRTLGVAPIAYILVASGLWWVMHAWFARGRRDVGIGLAGIFLAGIVLVNGQRYFQTYIDGLPYDNTPLGHEIAEYANMLPPETQVYLVGDKWEERMPETWSVEFAMTRPERFHYIAPDDLTCDELAALEQPALLIWSFHEALPTPQVEGCQQWLTVQQYASTTGLPLFNAAPLRLERTVTTPSE